MRTLRIGVGLMMASLAGCAWVTPGVDVGAATWTLPDGFAVGAETTTFLALVTERDCASGMSSEGRILGPEVEYGERSVIVTFRVRPLSGAQACPSNPATVVEVHLDEPLGNRTLLDGGREPPSEPPICAEPPFCE